MMSKKCIKELAFLDYLTGLYECIATDAYSTDRSFAWQKFLSLGLPSKQEESFQYFPLQQFYESIPLFSHDTPTFLAEDVKECILPECEGSALVFLDGRFCQELSQLSALPPQVAVSTLEEAYKSSYGRFIKHRIQMQLKDETDPFACLNASLCSEGTFVYIPPKTSLKGPIQCIHLTSSRASAGLFPRIHIFAGAHSCTEWISSLMMSHSRPVHYNGFFDVSLEEGASFTHFEHALDMDQTWGFQTVRATLKKESRFHSHVTNFGARGLRYDYKAALLGENADISLEGISLLKGANQSHVHVHVDHAAPFCQSHQLFKMLLAGHSRSSFSGKIYVRQSAQKTNAYQLNHNLLLSDAAIANSKPNLEIFADDVKASHGATMSQINEEACFYLRSRGLSMESAQALLTLGFCKDMLDKIPYVVLRDKLIDKAQTVFS